MKFTAILVVLLLATPAMATTVSVPIPGHPYVSPTTPHPLVGCANSAFTCEHTVPLPTHTFDRNQLPPFHPTPLPSRAPYPHHGG